MGFELEYPVSRMRPAAYNPRRMEDGAIERLGDSLRRFGCGKPVIVTREGLIVAGHQRQKAAAAIGMTHLPAYVVDGMTTRDEILFNQLHNGTDIDAPGEVIDVGASEALGFEVVPADLIHGNTRTRGAKIREEIGKLVLRYGPWGACVATQGGRVIAAHQYALAMRVLGQRCRVFRIPDDVAKEAEGFFMASYGQFSYAHLPKQTYIQAMAQLPRLSKRAGAKQMRSSLYENLVLPELGRHERVLDFGCGRGDYVRTLSAKGYAITGLEFFRRKGNLVDTRAVHRMIDAVFTELLNKGPFDVVVIDSVVNSVDSADAEMDVLTCANAVCRVGGRVYFSGRCREAIEGMTHRHTKTVSKRARRNVEFIDHDGFSGSFRQGTWFYQKFHTQGQALALANTFLGDEAARYFRHNEMAWQIKGTKRMDLPGHAVEASLRREFDLPWPEGKRIGRGEEAWQVYKAMRERFRRDAA